MKEDVEMRVMNKKDMVDGSGSEIEDNFVVALKPKAVIVMLILILVVGLSTFGGTTEYIVYESAIAEL